MDPQEVIVGVIGSAIVVYVVLFVFDGLSSLAPEKGDAWYSVWMSVQSTTVDALLLAVVGVPAAALFVIFMMRDGF